MKGYIYICEMIYNNQNYYKIGKAINVARRESILKTGNPFLSVIAYKSSFNPGKEEKYIHNLLKTNHFYGEWFKLSNIEYENLYKLFNFSDFSDDKRDIQLKNQPLGLNYHKKAEFHIFKKGKKTKDGKPYFRWYYYFYDSGGKKIQKACSNCRTRAEALSYINELSS